MSLDANVKAELLKNKAIREASKTPVESPTAPVVAPNQNGINGQTLATTVQAPPVQTSSQNIDNNAAPQPAAAQPAQPTQPVQDQSVTDTKKKGDESQPPAATTDEPITDAPLEFQWDKDIPDQPSALETVEKLDIKKIGSALNLEVQSETELVTQVKERLEKLKTLETTSNFEGVPDVLKQTLEVAKKGGDWLSYAGVSALDVSKLDEVELFEKEYIRAQAHRFKNPDGSFNEEKLDAELDGIAEGVKVMQGGLIKNQLINQQKQRQAQILAEATARQEAFQKNLGEATNQLAKLLPTEKFGIVIEPKHSSYLYEGITKGTLIKKHLGDIDPSILSKIPTDKLVKAIGLLEWGDKISEFRYKQGEVAGKKALLQSTQNIQLTPVSSHPTPEQPKPEEKPSSTEMLKGMKGKNAPANSL